MQRNDKFIGNQSAIAVNVCQIPEIQSNGTKEEVLQP